jgi:Bacterial DNA polymerase III alpha subunit finger domain
MKPVLSAFDIDVDIPVGTDIRRLFPSSIPASRVDKNELVKHPCGHYFENIAVDQLTGLAAVPHKEAAEIGYTKVDFLHLSLLNGFKTKTALRRACRKQPDWTLLQRRDVVEQLFQIKNHFDTVQRVKPTSIQELADVIALIRPDKRHLLPDYIRNKQKVRPMLYRSHDDDKSAFRAGHSLAYSVTIVAQLNTLTFPH